MVLPVAAWVLAGCTSVARVNPLPPDVGYGNSGAIVNSLHPSSNSRSCRTRNATSVKASIPTRSR
jgi:hypothetical protein